MHVEVNGTRLWFDVGRLPGPARARPLRVGRPRRLGLRLVEGFRRFDVVAQLALVDRPTLVCVGELDPVTPVEAAREIHEGLPEGIGRLEIIKGAGHFPWKSVPDRYWPLLSEFIVTAWAG